MIKPKTKRAIAITTIVVMAGAIVLPVLAGIMTLIGN